MIKIQELDIWDSLIQQMSSTNDTFYVSDAFLGNKV